MKSLSDLTTRTRHKQLQEFYEQALNEAEKVLQGKKPSTFKGIVGENHELIIWQIVTQKEGDTSGLNHAKEIDMILNKILLSEIDAPDPEVFCDCLTLATFGFIIGEYGDEEYRHVYRSTLSHLRNHELVGEHLRKLLIMLGLTYGKESFELFGYIRGWMKFLGTPQWGPSSFEAACNELKVDVTEVLESEDFRLIDSLRRHPAYLDEALKEKRYIEVQQSCKDWIPDMLFSKMLSVFKESVYRKAQEQISPDSTIQEAIDGMMTLFKREGFQSSDDSVLPVRLQDLKDPPPPEAINPVVFEMIPQKLRIQLMPAVAYSTKTKHIEIIFLGGAKIGTSAILIKTDTGGILMDYGMSVANQTIPEWVPELDMIDTVLVTHSHLDHLGALPVLYDKYDGKWCSAGITGAIGMVLLDDAHKVGTPLPPRKWDKWDMISEFTKANIDKVSRNHVSLECGKSSEVGGGIVVTPIESSHIPGSVAYVVDIEGVKILYTGDFNMDDSILFKGASLPTDCDYVIFDGTYWGREDFDRTRVSQQFSEIIKNHGPVIIPAFAVGRSQEVLMLLDDLGITQSRNVMVAGMAEKVTKLAGYSGDWQSMKKNKVVLEKEDVIVAGGGMMGGGLARHHFNEHRHNPDAAVILCGYLAPRTPGWNLLRGFEKHECRVEYARLSAHTSSSLLQKYASECTGKRIMVHTPVEETPKGLKIPGYRERVKIDV